MGRVEVFVAQVVLDWFEPGLDVADERQVGGLAVGVVGLTGHGDVAPDPFLRDRAVQLTQVEQPVFKVFGRPDWPVDQLAIPGLDLVPGLELGLVGDQAVRERLGSVCGRGLGHVIRFLVARVPEGHSSLGPIIPGYRLAPRPARRIGSGKG
jgi:hypothetical protein